MTSVLRLRILSFLALAASALAAPSSYQFVSEIPIGGKGGWDYVTVDSPAHRLYVSHATSVVVIDLDRHRVVGEIANTPGVHGIALAPDLKLGFTTNGRENTTSVVDLVSLQTTARIATGPNPDAMLYDPVRHEVYTFNGRGESATVIDATKRAVVATLALAGKPEFAVIDPARGRVYNNLEDKSEVIAIDTARHAVVARWSLAPGEEPTGLALDAEHHRLFAGCSNEKLVMLDADSGKVLATVPIGHGVDATAFDPGTQLAFASCGDGTVTIAHEDAPDRLTVVQVLKTEPRARTMAVDPATHRIYLPTASAPAAGEPAAFKVLVYGPGPAAAP